jgi:hypothetical protein
VAGAGQPAPAIFFQLTIASVVQVILELTAGVMLGTWFVTSLLAQIHWAGLRRALRLDVLQLVTQYSLFAPHPRMIDTRIRSRSIARDGSTSDWQNVWCFRRRSLMGAFWNPQRRADYAFAKDCWRVAALFRRGIDMDKAASTRSYRRLLNVVIHRAGRSELDSCVEFELATVTPQPGHSGPEEVVVRSGPHRRR